MAKLSHTPRFALLFLSLLLLILALCAALMRLGWNLGWLQARVALDHGSLMVCGFLGTLICLERAVALGRGWGYAAPVLSALGSLALAAGAPLAAAKFLTVLGSAGLVGIFVYVIRKQPALFTVTMGLGAGAWLAGNVLWFAGAVIPQMFHWWLAFLVLTIVGERLELNRLLAPSRYVKALFCLGVGLYLAGLVWTSLRQAPGEQLAGAGMLALALWLARYDVARFTVRRKGLPRFVALCLFGGYAWLGIGGLLWMFASRLENAGGAPLLLYDAVIHSVALGFVFSMIFAHAPIVFPAVTGRPLAFRRVFYAHVLLLHASLIWRIGGDLTGGFSGYRRGSLMTILAVLMFLAANVYGLAAGRREAKALAQAQKVPIVS